MRFLFLMTAATGFSLFAAAPKVAQAEAGHRISGPVVHESLSVYFVHGASADGPVPLTLQEALAKGTVEVRETGSVNELEIENTGAEEIFIQAGDIVKGGQQDRVLSLSLVLSPKSGRVPIGSFCVEQGRWSKRGMEDVRRFASAAEAMPSRKAKLAMSAPLAAARPATTAGLPPDRNFEQRGASETSTRQQAVWASVAETQDKLSAGLGAAVAAAESQSSLQLSLENEKLQAARTAYIAALESAGRQGDDIIGYVFAINGKLNSADVYPSNGLFRKMWPKLLAASVTEAIGDKDSAADKPPTVENIAAFLKGAENGKRHEQPAAALMRQEVRDADQAVYVEAQRADGRWVHRNYLAKH